MYTKRLKHKVNKFRLTDTNFNVGRGGCLPSLSLLPSFLVKSIGKTKHLD